YGPSPRMLENLLTVYVRAGLTDKSLELVKQVDLKAVSYTEVLGPTKTLNFYDIGALGDLATLYRQASLSYLEKAAAEARLKPPAATPRGVAYAAAGMVEGSPRRPGAFLSVADAPPGYQKGAGGGSAAGKYLPGGGSEPIAVGEKLAKRHPADPELLA